MATALLEIANLSVRYGGVTAVDGISFNVAAGEVVAMIGANGAGKSSTLMALCGLAPASGSIRFDGVEISGLSAVERIRRGIAQVPEGRRIFSRLTVFENLRMGAFHRSDASGIESDLDEVFGLFPILKERSGQKGGTLSGGEQQMLAIGRGVMARPRLMLLDEPSLGLSPIYSQKIFAIIRRLAEQGRSILLVEQNARAALKISSRAYCLETGRIFLEGKSSDLAEDSRVREAYLGG
jgi:branched-chain amino acid transport system ATP-binding protein